MYGKRLKCLREELNMKQSDLAKHFSISPSSIGMYEREEREPNIDLIIKFADFFNTSTDYLLGKTNQKKYEQKDSEQIFFNLFINEYHLPTEEQQKQIEEFAKYILRNNRKVQVND